MIGFLATVAPEKLASHELDASAEASGPHDFAVRLRAVRQKHIGVHRIPSRAYDDRETPLVPGRDQIDILLIWGCRQGKFLKIGNFLGAADAMLQGGLEPNESA